MKSITDPKVKELVEKNTILTGGSIANMLLNEEVKDFDIYFRNKETVLAVANYYVNWFNTANGYDAQVLDGAVGPAGDLTGSKSVMVTNIDQDRVKIIVKSKGVASEDPGLLDKPFEDAVEAISDADQIDEKMLEDDGKDKYRPIFLSSNAITLSDKIQIVIRFYGEAEEIHKNYDFVHCTNYYDYGKNELVLRQEALESLMAKELKYIGSKYPLCSVIRTRKFIKRGFHINAGQYLKMLFQVSELDLGNIAVLEDQLVGVDSAYFGMLIDALKAKQEENPDFKVESTYLATIIDRIF